MAPTGPSGAGKFSVRGTAVSPPGPPPHVPAARRRPGHARAAAFGAWALVRDARPGRRSGTRGRGRLVPPGRTRGSADHARKERPFAPDQQHGPAVRRRGGPLRAAAGDQLRGPGGHVAGISCRRDGRGGIPDCDRPLWRGPLARSGQPGRLHHNYRQPGWQPTGSRCTHIIDWAPTVEGVLAERAAGVSPSQIAAKFHNWLAAAAVAVAEMR